MKAYTLKIRGGVSVDSYGKKAGKGALIQEELSGTLGVSQDQYLFQPIAYGVDTYNQTAEEEVMQTIRTNGGGDCIPKVVYSIENHPNDSRVQFSKDGKVQALTSRMGTGGGNVPMILQSKGCYWDGSQVCGTLTAHNANGAQRMPDKENFTCVIQHKGGYIPQRQVRSWRADTTSLERKKR